MIGYDASTSYGSPSYYAQCLFGAHLGDSTPKSSITGASDRFFYSATVGTKDRVLHLKFVNASTSAQPINVSVGGMSGTGEIAISTLHASTYQATNSIEHPDLIRPVTSTAKIHGGGWTPTVPPLSIEVIDVPLR